MKKHPSAAMLFGALMLFACSKDKSTPTPTPLAVGQILGQYTGNVFMDYPDPTVGSGYKSIDKFDTLTLSQSKDSIMLSSPVLGQIKGVGVGLSPTVFQIRIPYQTNGQRNPTTGEKYTMANGDAALLIKLVNMKLQIFSDTLETDPCPTCTRYRVVSLEK